MSALITLPTLNSLPTPKCPQGIHMEVSHSLRVSWVLKVTSHGARCSLIPQGALEDAGFNGHLSWQASLQLHKLPKEMAHHQRIAFPLGIISLVLVDFLLDLAWPHFVSYSPCITIVITAFFFFLRTLHCPPHSEAVHMPFQSAHCFQTNLPDGQSLCSTAGFPQPCWLSQKP